MVEFAQITPLLELNLESINRLITQINQANIDAAISIAESQSRDGLQAKLSGNLDMNGYKILNLGTSGDDANAPNRRELRDRALYALPGQAHTTDRVIDATSGVIVPTASQGNLAPPLNQVMGAIAVSIENLDAQVAPPKVADASAIGPDNSRFSREEHAHQGVNLDDTQTITGAKTFTSTVVVPNIDTGNGAVELAAGVYTPTLTNVANLDASTAFQAQYLRVGSVVTVSGRVSVDPTLTATSTQLGISLPIASNFGATEDCGGVAAASAIAGQSAAILADTTNDRAQMQWISTDITAQTMTFTFTYRII